MSIFFHKEDREVPEIDRAKIKESVETFCRIFGKKAGEINFIYCSDDYLLNLNRQYLDHDYLTDVITFDYCEGEKVSGDIFMSRDRMEDNARKFEAKVEKEFIRVCGHGILHLLGFNDNSIEEKEKMLEKEEEFIKMTTV